MKGIIFYKSSYTKALEKLEEIIDNYKKLDYSIIQHKRSSIDSSVLFSNGDYWQIKPASQGTRGLACNIAYIERGIEKSIIDTIIMPTIKAKPYTAFNFW